VTYGDGAQSGGSRDTYHGSVDRSQGKTTYGDDAQIGGTRENSNLFFEYETLHD